MNGLTEILDPITERIEDFAKFGISAEAMSETLGGIAIGEIVTAIEKKFVRGWLRPALLAIGGLSSYYMAGGTTNTRLRAEGIVIGSDLIVNAIKEAVFNKDEVVESAKGTIEAIKSGNIAGVLSQVTNSGVTVRAPVETPASAQQPSVEVVGVSETEFTPATPQSTEKVIAIP